MLSKSEQEKPGRRQTIVNIIAAIMWISATILVYASVFCFLPSPEKYPFPCDPKKAVIHPFHGDTISATVLILLSHIIPVVVCFAVEAYNSQVPTACRRYSVLKRCQHVFLDFFTGMIRMSAVIEVTKWLIKEHRPHFYYTCQPDWNELICIDGFAVDYDCTSQDYINHRMKADLYKAFPSGHAGLSVYLFTFMSIYLQFRLQSNHILFFLRSWIQFLLLTLALACCITRVTDNQHYWWDVMTGAIIGLLGALYEIFCASSSHAFHWNRRAFADMDNKTPCETTPLICKKPVESEIPLSSCDEATNISRPNRSKPVR